MAGELTKEQIRALREAARRQEVKALRAAAAAFEGRGNSRGSGPDSDYAARLRAEADEVAEDPEFWNMDHRARRYKKIAKNVTAKSQAFVEKQRRAQASPKRVIKKPWYADADPILNELHTKNPEWKKERLREALEEQWGSKPERPDLPEPRAIERHIEKLFGSARKAK
jgi:hypothetical protein